MYTRQILVDALKFAFRRLVGFWLAAIPRVLITGIGVGAVTALVIGGLYYAIKKLQLLPADWAVAAFGVAAVLIVALPFLVLNVVVIRVALAQAHNRTLSLWVSPLIKPSLVIILGGLLQLIIVMFGFIALVVPGMYLAFRLVLFKLCAIDRAIGPVQALKCSWAETQEMRRDIWIFSFIFVALFVVLIIIMRASGMPLHNYATFKSVLSTVARGGSVQFGLMATLKGLGALVINSLWLLFTTHLYVALGRKES